MPNHNFAPHPTLAATPALTALQQCVRCGLLATDLAAHDLGWVRLGRLVHPDQTIPARCHRCTAGVASRGGAGQQDPGMH